MAVMRRVLHVWQRNIFLINISSLVFAFLDDEIRSLSLSRSFCKADVAKQPQPCMSHPRAVFTMGGGSRLHCCHAFSARSVYSEFPLVSSLPEADQGP